MFARGELKDTRLEAKDNLSECRLFQGQGQECSRPRLRTKDTGGKCSQKKRSLTAFFSRSPEKNGLQKFFSSGLQNFNQRWSRGHKARGQGQGQGHKKNPRPRPRPRTAFPRTEPLEAKDRNARGQGQGPRTQPQVFSKKKGLQKSFPDNLQFKGVARIFDWGGLNHKSHAMTSSKICLLFT